MAQEVEQIMTHIAAGHNFLLSGGAGSGKTYTLVQVIQKIIHDNPSKKIACITYTNSAVNEIENRVNHKNIKVLTIHDFLWDCIANFQQALKCCVIDLINKSIFKHTMDLPLPPNFYDGKEIVYKEYTKLSDGIISHDEVLTLSEYMFGKYNKLCDILKCTYPFILVDEYQDTSPLVVKILLEHLSKTDIHKCIVGFFGDAMQSIYDNSIGNLDYYKNRGMVYEVPKEQNRRNPKAVIDLANKLRTDDLVQCASSDINAPNMKDGAIIPGDIIFVYTTEGNSDIEVVRDYLVKEKQWDFNPKITKELHLTHNLIALEAGFKNLLRIHNSDLIIKYTKNTREVAKQKAINTENKTFHEIRQLNLIVDSKFDNYITQNPNLLRIADGILFDDLANTYVDKDELMDYKKHEEEEISHTMSKQSNLNKHLNKIEECIYFYEKGMINDFLHYTNYQIKTLQEKRNLKSNIEKLIDLKNNSSIKEVIEFADKTNLVRIDDKLEEYKQRNTYIYEQVMRIKYTEYENVYSYINGISNFSTLHKTKGQEFDNILLNLDNGKWRNYDFSTVFTNVGTETVKERSRKLFYVCCTRAKHNLAVYMHQPSELIIQKAKELFGISKQLD